MAAPKEEPPIEVGDSVIIDLKTRAHTPTRISNLVHDPEVEAWLPRRGRWLGPLTTALAFAIGVVATWLVLNEKGPIAPTKLPPPQEPVASGGLVPARLEVPPAAVAAVAVAVPPTAPAPTAPLAPALVEPGAPPPVTLPEGVIPPLPGLPPEPVGAVPDVAAKPPTPTPTPTPIAAKPPTPVAAKPPPPAEAKPPEPAPAGPIAVDVTSDPPGAAVVGPAGLLGTTPLTAVLDGSQPNTLTLSLAGRRSKTVRLKPGATELHVELPPQRAP